MTNLHIQLRRDVLCDTLPGDWTSNQQRAFALSTAHTDTPHLHNNRYDHLKMWSACGKCRDKRKACYTIDVLNHIENHVSAYVLRICPQRCCTLNQSRTPAASGGREYKQSFLCGYRCHCPATRIMSEAMPHMRPDQ